MSRQESYTKLERELVPQLRQGLDTTESTQEVRKVFSYTARHLLVRIMVGEVELIPDDIQLMPEREPWFELGPGITENPYFKNVWENSDLPQILGRFAEASAHRYQHLDKNPAKTEAKMYHGRDGMTQNPGETRP